MQKRWYAEMWVLVLMLVAMLTLPKEGWAKSEGKLEGFVDVPGDSLSLPLPAGSSPVTIIVNVGIPLVPLPVVVNTATAIEAEEGLALPITLVDGDRVKIEFDIVGFEIRAEELEMEDFPELELRGTVDVPNGTLTLPVSSDTQIQLTLGDSIVTLPLTITPDTKIEEKSGPGNSLVLHDGDTVEVEVISRGGVGIVTEIEPEDDEDED